MIQAKSTTGTSLFFKAEHVTSVVPIDADTCTVTLTGGVSIVCGEPATVIAGRVANTSVLPPRKVVSE